MRLIFLLIIVLTSFSSFSREAGETEITTDDGIEVFQNEKYYLLKKNVHINSDTFKLSGDKVEIFFEKDLYDIKIIDATGNVKLKSPEYLIDGRGEKLILEIENEKIHIIGNNSVLITENTEMYSDGEIKVNNLNGKFFVIGKNSKLISDDVYIEGEYIDGIFSTIDGVRDINILNVEDKLIGYIKTEDTEMYANTVKYNKETSLIELLDNVKIIRDGETITGDYGTLDTKTNSYKVKSNNTKKVKVIISNKDE